MFGDSYKNKKSLSNFDNVLLEERKWREWTDNVLVHTLSPNIYRSWNEALESFEYFSKVGEWEKIFPSWERYLVIYVGASVMYFVGKRLKKRHNLKGDIRDSLYDCCKFWLKSIGKNKRFMGGDQPNLADLAVYGVLSSIEGCQAFKDLLRNVELLGPWYYSIKELCSSQTGSFILEKSSNR